MDDYLVILHGVLRDLLGVKDRYGFDVWWGEYDLPGTCNSKFLEVGRFLYRDVVYNNQLREGGREFYLRAVGIAVVDGFVVVWIIHPDFTVHTGNFSEAFPGLSPSFCRSLDLGDPGLFDKILEVVRFILEGYRVKGLFGGLEVFDVGGLVARCGGCDAKGNVVRWRLGRCVREVFV
jgi:hypothetical protein